MLHLSKANNGPEGLSPIRELLSHGGDRPRIDMLEVPLLSTIEDC